MFLHLESGRLVCFFLSDLAKLAYLSVYVMDPMLSIITPSLELLKDLIGLLTVKHITKLERSRYVVNVSHYYIVLIIATFIQDLLQSSLSVMPYRLLTCLSEKEIDRERERETKRGREIERVFSLNSLIFRHSRSCIN